MSEKVKDILVKIPDEDLPKLATVYEKCISWAPYMVSFVHTFIKWKKSEKHKDYINFWSPYNSWKEDGAIVAILSENKLFDVYIFTLNVDCSNLYDALMQTSLIDYSKRVLFYALHEKHFPTVKKCLEDMKISITWNIPTYIYVVPPEEGKKLTIECPPEVYLKKLEPSAAKQVNAAWPHRFRGSENYLKTFIEVNGGWGVFLKSTDEMVAWVLKHAFGHLGMLQTEEEHKRKGYGSLVTKALSKEIAEEGHWPMGTIILNNHSSIKIFEKMGFRNIGICRFVIIEPDSR